jgi:type IV pilus assembly protein PilC
MAEFVVRLADERGRVQEQTHSAATEDELRARFTQAGYYVYSVKARGVLAGTGKKKVKLETFLVFNQQFLTLIRAGLPILGSIELLARRQKLLHFRAQLEDVAVRVKNGESISSAFEAQGGFPIVYTTTLLAGERSGNLEEVLQRYLDFQRVSLTFRKKLVASLIYPAVLVVMVIALFIFLITFVVPRFAELYEQLGTTLPAITSFLLALGKNAQSYGIYAVAVLALTIFLFTRWIKTEAGALLVDRVRIRLPLFGPVWLKYQVGLCRRFSPVVCRWFHRWRPPRARSTANRSATRSSAASRRCARARASPSASQRRRSFPNSPSRWLRSASPPALCRRC